MAVSQAIGRAHIIAVHAEIELHRLVIAQIAHLNRFCGVNDRNSRLFSRSALGVGQPFCAPRRRSAICANLPFIAIAKGPEAAPKLSSPRARRLSFDPQPGSVYIISRGAAAARLVHLAFATETPTLTIVDDATFHATALDRRRRMFNFCSHGNRDIGRSAQHRLEGAHALRQRLP